MIEIVDILVVLRILLVIPGKVNTSTPPTGIGCDSDQLRVKPVFSEGTGLSIAIEAVLKYHIFGIVCTNP